MYYIWYFVNALVGVVSVLGVFALIFCVWNLVFTTHNDIHNP